MAPRIAYSSLTDDFSVKVFLFSGGDIWFYIGDGGPGAVKIILHLYNMHARVASLQILLF